MNFGRVLASLLGIFGPWALVAGIYSFGKRVVTATIREGVVYTNLDGERIVIKPVPGDTTKDEADEYLAERGFYKNDPSAEESWHGRLVPYILSIILALVISFLMWAGYGTHIEGARYEGPRGDNEEGYVVTDFVATSEDRKEFGVKVFLTLSIPLLYGTYKGRKNTVRACKNSGMKTESG